MGNQRGLLLQIDILRTLLREAATTIRRMNLGQRIETEPILKPIGLAITEAKELTRET